jgi:DNA-binding NarL/FixJ family response regulator
MTISVLLADDHPLVRQGLRGALTTEPEFSVVGEAGDGIETVRLAERLQPDVLVLDLMMPGLGGLDVLPIVRQRSPRTRVVVLSMHSNEAYVLEALRAGATAYVVKDAGVDELVRAVREAAAGRRYLSPPLSESALGAYARRAGAAPADPYQTLTAREREVLQLTAEGHSGGAIAERLFISPRTVETHRANVMRKLGLRNQKEVVRYALTREARAVGGE